MDNQKPPEYGSQDFYRGMAMLGNVMFLAGILICLLTCLVVLLS